MRGPENVCTVSLTVCLDGAPRPSYTTFLRPCAYGVMVDTKVLGPELRLHLNSDYLGDPDGTARSTHFADAPGLSPLRTSWSTIEHPAGQLDVRWTPSQCLYDHLQRLLELTELLGHAAKVEVSDEAVAPFEAAARGLSVSVGCPEARMRPDVADALSTWGLSPYGPPPGTALTRRDRH